MRLWELYHENMPDFLREFAAADALLRLKRIGMNCGLEYTGFSLFQDGGSYTRFEHSVGAALIVWHFTGDKRQTVASLLHDLATPVFAHTVDFLNHDHMKQESTEGKTTQLITDSVQLMRLLVLHRLSVEDVCDYHRYPVADNDAPRLSSDRLEYTLGNCVRFGFRTFGEAAGYYRDLIVAKNEFDADELVFRSEEAACGFAGAALENARVYVSDADRFCMQYLAELLRRALNLNVITERDLFTTEPQVIEKLISDPETAALWTRFRGFSEIHRLEENPEHPAWLRVPAKKRYIDPLAVGLGRVTALSPEFKDALDRFLSESFDVWISVSPRDA